MFACEHVSLAEVGKSGDARGGSRSSFFGFSRALVKFGRKEVKNIAKEQKTNHDMVSRR